METGITIVLIIVVFIIIYKNLQYDEKKYKENYQKNFKIEALMRRLPLQFNQTVVFFDGLLLENNKNQLIQIISLDYNRKVLLINRNNSKKKIKIKLNKLTIQNIENIREWVLHGLYDIK